MEHFRICMPYLFRILVYNITVILMHHVTVIEHGAFPTVKGVISTINGKV